jgi:hypothetical protein
MVFGVSQRGQSLVIATNNGGCADLDELRVCFWDLQPDSVQLDVDHRVEGGFCDAFRPKYRQFDLGKLKQEYVRLFGRSDSRITIRVAGRVVPLVL